MIIAQLDRARSSALALLVASGRSRSAQGTLSTLGFGYPAGQISTRALGTGGAIAEFDPLSPTNPAAIARVGGIALYIQVRARVSAQLTSAARSQNDDRALPARRLAPSRCANLYRRRERLQPSSTAASRRTCAATQIVGDDGARRRRTSSRATARSPTCASRSLGADDAGSARRRRPRDHRRQPAAQHAACSTTALRFAPLIDTSTVTYVGSAVSAGVELFAGNIVGARRVVPEGRHDVGQARRHDARRRRNVPDRLGVQRRATSASAARRSPRAPRRTRGRACAGSARARCRSPTRGTRASAPTCSGPRLRPARSSSSARARRWRTLPFGLATQRGEGEDASVRRSARCSPRPRGARPRRHPRDARPGASAIDARETAWTLSFGITVRP